jgi:ankyrin repeat protein
VLVAGCWLIASPARSADADSSQRLVGAAARGDLARVAALLRQGAEPNARDDAGRPAVLAAAIARRPEIVRALAAAGADLDASDRNGWTALHEAVAGGERALAATLLEEGASPDLLSRDRGMPLDIAEQAGLEELAALLRSRGARGSGKSLGDTVCVRPWRGEGYCGVVEARDRNRYRLRLGRLVGCESGCVADPDCSSGRPVGGGAGLSPGDVLWVPGSCLTHTGVR